MSNIEIQKLSENLSKVEMDVNSLLKTRNDSQLKSPLDAASQRIIQNIVIYPITFSLPGVNAAVAGNYSHFFIADQGYLILGVEEVHAVAGSDASAVTVQLEKLTSTTAPGSGTSLLVTAFDLKGTANTVQYGNFSNVSGYNTLIRGDRLALKKSGTLTAVDSVVITVYLQKL